MTLLQPRCPRCDGLLVLMTDITGEYMDCLACGLHLYCEGAAGVGLSWKGSRELGLLAERDKVKSL